MRRHHAPAAACILAAFALAACQAPMPKLPPGWESGGGTQGWHAGPLVATGDGGTGRFAARLLADYDPAAAMETVTFADRFYREPANEGFDATLDHVIDELRAAGFGLHEGYELRVVEQPQDSPAWTPRSASLTLIQGGREAFVLHRFDADDDRDRTMLPSGAPSADVEGGLCLALEDLRPGEVLVTDQPLGSVLAAAAERGAAFVVSSHLRSYNVDPTGRGRHEEAILYTGVGGDAPIPVCQISPGAHARLRRAGAGARLHLRAVVDLEQRALRTVVATVVGFEQPSEVVALVAHVQEPGACDNASGIGGLLESARSLARSVEERRIARPKRSVAFVWGAEFAASRAFLDSTGRQVVAAFSADMVGSSKTMTGAICLLERSPDPGALTPLPPDEHTPWGAGAVDAASLRPDGLSIITRLALVDVGLAAGQWETSEHPWEGGSDHDVFLGRGVPAVLLWHFTDFAYHTSLDRLDHVDPIELQLTCTALLTAAMGVADGQPADLERYLDSLNFERRLRLAVARESEADPVLIEQWTEWFTGARHWLRAVCLSVPFPGD